MVYKKPHAKLISSFIFALLLNLIGFTGSAQTSYNHEPLIQRDILKVEIKNYLIRIQTAYDEIDEYCLDNSKNKIHQEATGLLRTGSFYVYHLWEMTQTKKWLDSQNSDYISKYKSDQIKKGFEKFLQKHEKIKSLLSNLSKSINKNTNSTTVDQLVSQLRGFHSLKLFSSLSGNALTPLTIKDAITQVTITEATPPYDPIDQVSFGESFRVKVVFEKAPGLDAEPVTIRVKPGKLEIQTVAHKTDDPLVYLSNPLQTIHK
jgi:hypothetical protein